MKITFRIPAHPLYYGNLYTQEQIDKVIAEYDASLNFVISKGHTDLNNPRYFQLIRTPGEAIKVVLDPADALPDLDISEAARMAVICNKFNHETRVLDGMIKEIHERLKQSAEDERAASQN